MIIDGITTLDGTLILDETLFINTVIADDIDSTKQVAFDVSGITTGTTRTILMPDQNINLTPGTTFQAWDAQLDDIAALSPTKGNLIVGDGTNWVFVGVGADGQVLNADSAQTEGVAWITLPGASSAFADNLFRIQDDGDATKQIAFEASGITTVTTRTITMPDADVDLTLVGSALQDITGESIGNLSDVTITVAATDDFLVFTGAAWEDRTPAQVRTTLNVADNAAPDQNLWATVTSDSGSTTANLTADTLVVSGGTNITTAITGDTLTITGASAFADNLFRIQDNGDATKQLAFEVSAITTATTRTITMPDNNINLADLNTALQNLIEDATPQLGGSLDVNANSIISTSNNDIPITPGGTGEIILDALNWPKGVGTAGQVLQTDGVDQLSFISVGGAQNVFVTVTPDSGGNVVAENSTDTLTLAGGEGVTTVGTPSTDTVTLDLDINSLVADATPAGAADFVVTFDTSAGSHKKVLLNNLPGGGGGDPDQNLWETITSDSGSTVANITTDTLTIAGGTGISTAVAGDTLTITNTGGGPAFADNVFRIQDNADATKQLAFEVSGLETSSTATWTVPIGNLDFAPGTGSFATAAEGDLAATALQNIVEDTTPQLGGSLDVNGNSIVSVAAGNIAITPDTSGSVVLDGLSWPQADGTVGQAITTNGAGQLAFSTVGGSQNLFETIAVSGESNVVAEIATDTLTLVAGANMTITTNAGADSVTFASSGGGSGLLLQRVFFQDGAVATGTTQIPNDDSIPTFAEGTLFMSASITPTAADSILRVSVTWNGADSAGGSAAYVTLFRDATGTDPAIAAAPSGPNGANFWVNVHFIHEEVSGSTSATTFQVRAGIVGAGTVTFNGQSTNARLGGVIASSIVIEEFAP